MQTTTMTSKGQVTIPKEIRLRLGLRQGMQVAFVIEGDHAVLRPATPDRPRPPSGFGLVKVLGRALPADFDVATLMAAADVSAPQLPKPGRRAK